MSAPPVDHRWRMTLKTWLLFLVMETALSLSPGPAVFYVVSQGVRGGLRRTLPSACGILSANGIYFALSATSLGRHHRRQRAVFYDREMGGRRLPDLSGNQGIALVPQDACGGIGRRPSE